MKRLKIDIYNTDKKYDIIYTDPAWKQTKGNKRKCRPNQGKELDYQTCTLDELKEIHRVATELCNEKHNIFMWTIDKYLHESEQMMKELGYELHARRKTVLHLLLQSDFRMNIYFGSIRREIF